MRADEFSQEPPQPFLKFFSKLTCCSTLLLIFVGGLVTSTGSGLAVPDWPLSYGTLFPPMVGGVLYEHGHRMAAGIVGFCMLILAVSLARWEKRRWVKVLGFCALGAVVLQGVLGGLTVLLFLPPPISVLHGVLAQSFFVLTIIIAYAESQERQVRHLQPQSTGSSQVNFIKMGFIFAVAVYVQLIVAAIMRHTHSGLAIPDFPTMGGYYWPPFNEAMLNRINAWRFENDLAPVTMPQVAIHFIHRVGAAVIAGLLICLTLRGLKDYAQNHLVKKTILLLNVLVFLQILLGILTILTRKAPVVTSLHVMNGAAVLGTSVVLILRAVPTRMQNFRDCTEHRAANLNI